MTALTANVQQFDPGIDAEVQAQVLEAQLAAIAAAKPLTSVRTGNSEVDASLEGGAMGIGDGILGDKRTLYNTLTGEPLAIPARLLAKTLAKRRDGRPAFSIAPAVEYVRGSVMCLFHPDHPDRATLREAGLANVICGGGDTAPAGNLASEYDHRMHLASAHSKEWKMLEEGREREERLAQHAFQREQLELMRQAMTANLPSMTVEANRAAEPTSNRKAS